MGFIVATETKLQNGLNLSGCYYTLKAECTIKRQLRNSVNKYVVSGFYDIYASLSAYSSGSLPLDSRLYVEVELSDLTEKEPLTELYDRLKSDFVSVTDA